MINRPIGNGNNAHFVHSTLMSPIFVYRSTKWKPHNIQWANKNHFYSKCFVFFSKQRTDERITNKLNKNDRFLFMIIRDYRNTFGLKYIEHFVALKLHVNCSRHFSYVFKILICLIRFLFVSEKKPYENQNS